jgi:hypothetical protein
MCLKFKEVCKPKVIITSLKRFEANEVKNERNMERKNVLANKGQ